VLDRFLLKNNKLFDVVLSQRLLPRTIGANWLMACELTLSPNNNALDVVRFKNNKDELKFLAKNKSSLLSFLIKNNRALEDVLLLYRIVFDRFRLLNKTVLDNVLAAKRS
jgi:hypothetical protein